MSHTKIFRVHSNQVIDSDVPAGILRARESWADKSAYDATAKKLAALFNNNFETYAAGASAEIRAAAPVA